MQLEQLETRKTFREDNKLQHSHHILKALAGIKFVFLGEESTFQIRKMPFNIDIGTTIKNYVHVLWPVYQRGGHHDVYACCSYLSLSVSPSGSVAKTVLCTSSQHRERVWKKLPPDSPPANQARQPDSHLSCHAERQSGCHSSVAGGEWKRGGGGDHEMR